MRTTPGFFTLFTLLLLAITGFGMVAYFRIFWGIVFFMGLLMWILRSLWKAYTIQFKKIQTLFDAVQNNDYAFRFPEKGVGEREKQINRTFNAMRELLSKAKSEAAEKEKYYELIMGRVTTGIVVIDPNGFVYQTNEAALSLLGLSVLTHTQQLRQIDESLPTLLNTLLPESNRQISFHTELGEKHLTIDVSELKGKDTSLRIIALNDIDSELDENEIESWSRLTRVLTHEIMNGISPILSLCELLLRKEEARGHIKEGLEVIHHTGTQLSSFVKSYRQFTRIPEPVKSIFDLREFLHLEIIGMRATTPRPIRFDLNVQPEDLMLYADKNLISQVIINIVKNAILALKETEQPYIRITAQSNSKEHILIDIDNNGPMIDPEVGKQIFVPFFTTSDQGSGIGLSVSKQIMRLHHGSLKLTYSTPAETRFSLVFK